ncbi:hypothetical protein J14TS2_53490 [Bacillus sp. J14TS2]|uniref:hypothetical protein n=1 Tax=Bacillus sp. J14TS2 TaxID=2807188 RepID=UPI001B100E7A|nr:hypothetical protein [Bacillus sp. J14TS2]GIN74874.1 hypothetical protein J14TS2_53490 [Bacillus sp. J14TS2]
MRLYNSIREIHRNGIIFVYPIIYDLIALAIGFYFIGFNGQSMFSVKLILEMGFPSVSHIENIPLFANQLSFFNGPAETTFFSGVAVLILIVIRTFLQGGYIQSLHTVVEGESYSFSEFIKASKKNWLQFLFLEIILYFLKISLTAFLVIFFPGIGGFAALCSLIVLRIIFIYLEFTIVLDKVHIPGALKLSRTYLAKSLVPTMLTIIVMYVICSGLSLFIHIMWSPTIVIGMILMYSYIMTLIQLVFMTILSKTRK